MTSTCSAIATGLPAFDRRRLLGSAALASIVVATAAAPALGAEHSDDELLGLVELAIAADARRDDYGARSDEAHRTCYTAPPFTEAMLWRESDASFWDVPERLDSATLGGVTRHIYDANTAASRLRSDRTYWRMSGAGIPADVERVEEILAAVEAWQAAEMKAQEVCGCAALDRAFESETEAVDLLLAQIFGMPARTTEGICAKVRAAGLLYVSDRRLPSFMMALVGNVAKLDASASAVSGDRSAA